MACQELVCVERTADPANHLPAATLRTSAGEWQAGDVLDVSCTSSGGICPNTLLVGVVCREGEQFKLGSCHLVN